MSVLRGTSRAAQFAQLTATEMLSRLVSGNAVGAAQDLLKSLDDEEFNNLVEQVGLLLEDQGVELPDWKSLSDDELRKIAIGAFYLQDGKLVLLPEA
jgi:hypothetical protein